MCTAQIATSTASGAATGALFGPVGSITGALIGAGAGLTVGAGIEGKGPLSGIKPSTPKPPAVKPPPDLALKEKQERARALQRTLAGRPGAGRRATIFSQPTGAGPAGLKTKAGQ